MENEQYKSVRQIPEAGVLMPRIRTIKPEFPQSESMGRISRDARLSFIMLWTLADDSGRLRGNSRMLASLLYPYDEDARGLIDGWLFELEKEGCIDRYVVEGDSYIEIRNWLTHQKIDKPSKSKIPAFVESSRILANPRESSSGDLDLEGIKDQCSPEASPSLKQMPFNPESIEGLNLEAWNQFVEYRKQRKPAIKACSAKAAAEELAGYGANQLAVVKQSIAKQWQGLFDLKTSGKPNGKHPTETPEQRSKRLYGNSI